MREPTDALRAARSSAPALHHPPTGINVLHVDAHRHAHQHVLRPLHHLAVDAQQVRALQRLRANEGWRTSGSAQQAGAGRALPAAHVPAVPAPAGAACRPLPACLEPPPHTHTHLEPKVVVVKVAVVHNLRVQAAGVCLDHLVHLRARAVRGVAARVCVICQFMRGATGGGDRGVDITAPLPARCLPQPTPLVPQSAAGRRRRTLSSISGAFSPFLGFMWWYMILTLHRWVGGKRVGGFRGGGWGSMAAHACTRCAGRPCCPPALGPASALTSR